MYTVVTWGALQLVSGNFIRTYADEAYVYLSPDWIYAGVAPNRIDLAELARDLSALNAAALPKLNWPGLLSWAKLLIARFGPAAVPLIEGIVANLPLTPVQIAAIDCALGGGHRQPCSSELSC